MPILEKGAFKIKGENVKKRISNETKLLILNISDNPQGLSLRKKSRKQYLK
jgi:aspartate/methionine/tyrosine aminotransferase